MEIEDDVYVSDGSQQPEQSINQILKKIKRAPRRLKSKKRKKSSDSEFVPSDIASDQTEKNEPEGIRNQKKIDPVCQQG